MVVMMKGITVLLVMLEAFMMMKDHDKIKPKP